MVLGKLNSKWYHCWLSTLIVPSFVKDYQGNDLLADSFDINSNMAYKIVKYKRTDALSLWHQQ